MVLLPGFANRLVTQSRDLYGGRQDGWAIFQSGSLSDAPAVQGQRAPQRRSMTSRSSSGFRLQFKSCCTSVTSARTVATLETHDIFYINAHVLTDLLKLRYAPEVLLALRNRKNNARSSDWQLSRACDCAGRCVCWNQTGWLRFTESGSKWCRQGKTATFANGYFGITLISQMKLGYIIHLWLEHSVICWKSLSRRSPNWERQQQDVSLTAGYEFVS